MINIQFTGRIQIKVLNTLPFSLVYFLEHKHVNGWGNVTHQMNFLFNVS